ncbi:hypothetical protein [Mycolicibacterium sp. CR10]|uniref:hypothetical protein n=1 Tax=Mycolicibacterium sp. CR10 TaxID=2562314 RepID=UPI0010BFCDCF|nr:hypothetical protein [Mycolicibacterium sp. CR10]
MSTAFETPTPARVDPRTRSMAGWRARLGALASRGETDGPRVEACRTALAWWRHRGFLVTDIGLSVEQAEDLLDAIAEAVSA